MTVKERETLSLMDIILLYPVGTWLYHSMLNEKDVVVGHTTVRMGGRDVPALSMRHSNVRWVQLEFVTETHP